jgi:hypothetical protein
MGSIFINVNSAVPPPVWNRSQHAQKYLVLDLASQRFPMTSDTSLPTPVSTPATLSYPSIEALTESMTALVPPSLSAYAVPGADPNDLPGIVELFLDLYYKRHGTCTSLLMPGNEHGGWRALLPHWLNQSPILDSAIRALATSFVGMQHQDGNLVDLGRNFYLKTLQMVQQAIPEPGSTCGDLLATTLVMASTELFLGNGGGASQLTHIEGATHLLHSTISNCSGRFEELHAYILNQGLHQALSTRRPYVFSLAEYRSLAHQIYSAPRTSSNDLYFQWCETILPLPNILSAVDSLASSAATLAPMTSSTPSPASTALSILDDIITLERSISPWYKILKASTTGPWTVPAAHTTVDSVPFPLQFVSIEACTLFCIHWTSQLLILEARQSLYSHLPHSLVPEHPPLNTLLPQIAEYASLICRSVQFCTQGASYASTENMFLPLFTTAGYYKRHGDEERYQWCVGAFSKIAVEQKIGYAAEMLEVVERRVIVQEAYSF